MQGGNGAGCQKALSDKVHIKLHSSALIPSHSFFFFSDSEDLLKVIAQETDFINVVWKLGIGIRGDSCQGRESWPGQLVQ